MTPIHEVPPEVPQGAVAYYAIRANPVTKAFHCEYCQFHP